MPDPSTLLLFAAATAALLLVPGPSVMFVVACTLEHGRAGGVVSALGVEAGALLHVAAATFGLSALIAASPTALFAVKLGGAVYLVVLGVTTLRTRHDPPPRAARSRRGLFLQGVVVDALNPKTAMFFLAFLPQFVDPARGAVTTQIAALGVLFVVLAGINDIAYAIAAGAIADRLRRSRRARHALRRLSGTAYVALGALTGISPA